MPKVARHVSPKGPLWGKRATNCWALLPQREMTYEDKAPCASTPACMVVQVEADKSKLHTWHATVSEEMHQGARREDIMAN